MRQEKTKIDLRVVEIKLQNLPQTTCCPLTKMSVEKSNCQTFAIPEGQATWWYCSDCGGWHLILQR